MLTAVILGEILAIPTVTIRQLEDDVYQGLKAQAESSGRSMEAEVRDILAATVRGRAWWPKWVAATGSLYVVIRCPCSLALNRGTLICHDSSGRVNYSNYKITVQVTANTTKPDT